MGNNISKAGGGASYLLCKVMEMGVGDAWRTTSLGFDFRHENGSAG